MYIKNLGEIEAIAFDIDGTLYPQYRLTYLAFMRYLRYGVFFLYYGLTRNKLHHYKHLTDFRLQEATIMAKYLGCSAAMARKRLDDIIYKGLAPYFHFVKCFDNMTETLKTFKEKGLKLALLSDFPPEQKGDVWGVLPYCDVVLGTEELGALKPHPYSFIKLSEALGVKSERILYVGNSIKYDIRGAKAVGMKTAYLMSYTRRLFNLPLRIADLSFRNYIELRQLVLGE